MALDPKDFTRFLSITDMNSGWSFRQQGSRVRVTSGHGEFVETISTTELQRDRDKVLNEEELRAVAMTYMADMGGDK